MLCPSTQAPYLRIVQHEKKYALHVSHLNYDNSGSEDLRLPSRTLKEESFMNGPEFFNQIRTQLAGAIARRDQVPAFNPIRVSPWVAMALLQKAIRRGRTDFALQAAATLLLDAPDRLWRRCG